MRATYKLELKACRVCLATDTKLYSIFGNDMEELFIGLLGTSFSAEDGLPQHVCYICNAQLLKSAALRRRAQTSYGVLMGALLEIPFLSTDMIRSIDRKTYKLKSELRQINAYTFNSKEEKKLLIGNHRQVETLDTDPFCDIIDQELDGEINNLPEVITSKAKTTKEIYNKLSTDAKRNRDRKTSKLKPGLNKINTFDSKDKNKLIQGNNSPIEILEPDPLCDIKEAEFEDEINNEPEVITSKTETTEVKTNVPKSLFLEIDGLSMKVKTSEDLTSEEHATEMEPELKTIEELVPMKKEIPRKQKRPLTLDEREKEELMFRKLGMLKLWRYMTMRRRKLIEKPLTKRRPENEYVPSFDHGQFEKLYNCTIKILSKQEQIQEIADRKRSSNYLTLKYKCEFCGKGFEFERTFKNHMAKHDPNNGKFTCDVCHAVYGKRTLLRHHVDTHATKITCNMCSFVTRIRHSARRHFDMHIGKVYKCDECDVTFTKITTYFGHMRHNHPSPEFVCEICGDSFLSLTGVKYHRNKAHRTHNTTLPATHECAVCKFQFVSEEALQRHAELNVECHPDLMACAECGEMFETEELLNVHTESRHVHRCEPCSKSFISEESLETHYNRVHLKLKRTANGRTKEMRREYYEKLKKRTKPAICEMCGSILMSNAALERHQERQCKREPSANMWQCHYCDKACSTQQTLKVHLLLHTGEKPSRCDQCPLAFRQSGMLSRHKKKDHLGLDIRAQCSICDKFFASPSTLKLHVRTVHMKLPHPPRRRRTRRDSVQADI